MIEVNYDELDTTQEYWYFRLEFTNNTSGRCRKKDPIVRVKISKGGNHYSVCDYETGKYIGMISTWDARYCLSSTLAEAEEAWQAIIDNELDKIQASYEKAIKAVKKHIIKKKK